jgi:hypothetical protein
MNTTLCHSRSNSVSDLGESGIIRNDFQNWIIVWNKLNNTPKSQTVRKMGDSYI